MQPPVHPQRSIAPGLQVLRRDRRRWQVGLDRSRAVLVPAPADDRVDALLDEPRLASLVVDRTRLPVTDLDERERAAVVQRDPAAAPARLRRRAASRVRVLGTLGVAAEPLLTDAGVRTATAPADAVLAIFPGEADRHLLDALVRDRLPHLVVRLVDGVVTLGPFVVPGRTACLRCIDAHLAVDDPAHHALVAQHARVAGVPGAGWAAPVDLSLATLATAWAVRDLVTHLEGDRPTTWSATIRLEPGLAAVTDTQWLRHPECGCCWLEDAEAPATMAP